MRAEGIAIALRPRSRWEAADLGVTLWRRWLGVIAGRWAIIVLPLQLAVVAVCCQAFDRQVGIPTAIVLNAWAMPAFARIALDVVADGVIGRDPRVRGSLGATLRLVVRRPFMALLRLRFDPARAFFAAIPQLEGLPDDRYAARRRVLADGGSNFLIGVWLVLRLLHLALFVGAVDLLASAMPDAAEIDVWTMLLDVEIGSAPAWLLALVVALHYACVGVSETLAVSIGFALYLNRRTLLESWDVEQVFRQMARSTAAVRAIALPREAA